MYLIFGVFLIINLAVGLHYGRDVKTLREYAVGNKDFSTFAIVSTIVSTWTTGSLLFFALSKIYTEGLYFLLALISHALYIIVVQKFFLLRMGEFLNNLSVAEAMGSLYGKHVRIITAVGGIIKSFGMITSQFVVTTSLLQAVFGPQDRVALVALLGVVVLYSFWGGIKAVAFTDIVQFFAFGVVIPILALIMWHKLDNPVDKIKAVFREGIVASSNTLSSNPVKAWAFYTLIIYFLIPTMSPTFFQRIVINRNLVQAKKTLKISFFICLAIIFLFSWLGILLFASDSSLMVAKKNIFLHLLNAKNHHIGEALTCLSAIGIMAIVISSIDSHINTASVLFTNDIAIPLKLPKKYILNTARFAALSVGFLSLMVSLQIKSPLNFILRASMFYMPVVTVPFTLAIFGFRTSKKSVLIGMLAGILSSGYWEIFYKKQTGIKSALLGVVASVVFLFLSHYLLKQKGGWIGVKEKAPLLAAKQAKKRRWQRFISSIKNFSLDRYLQENLPKQEHIYPLVGFYVVGAIYCSFYALPSQFIHTHGTIFQILAYSVSILATCLITYPMWSISVRKRSVIALFWSFSIFYILFLSTTMLVLISGFQFIHVMIFIVNLMLTVLLLRWQLVLFMALLGPFFAISTFHTLGIPFLFTNTVTSQIQVVYIALILSSGLLALFKHKQRATDLEQRQVTLNELKKSAEDALDQLKIAPDYFIKQVSQTNTAGIQSAYTLSQTLQANLHDGAISKEIQKVATQLTQQIGQSASYLEKTIHSIETRIKLQKSTLPLQQFLNQLYDELPGLEEGALLFDNQSKAKTLQCDVAKIHRLLRKTYEHIQLQVPDQDYFYLHVRDTILRYPNHSKPIPALAFLFTQVEAITPNVAPSYAHLDKIPIDPHLAGNRFFKDAQIIVDKHYGYLDLAKIPNEYLIVLPTRLDAIRPKSIEDAQAPSYSLSSELLREAKRVEADFWHTITEQSHYDIVEIEEARENTSTASG